MLTASAGMHDAKKGGGDADDADSEVDDDGVPFEVMCNRLLALQELLRGFRRPRLKAGMVINA